jgi:phage terminase large subunit-like protein
VVAGPHVRNACRRHLDDLRNGPKRGLRWDLDAANKAISFFGDVLRLNGGQFEGRPFDLHPSQAFRIGSLFGWKKADGSRRFRRFYDEEAKGNGKSPLLAGISMWCLLADGEDRAEVYAAASKKDQAMVLFRDAVAMFQQSPALAARLTPSGGNPVWNLADLKTGSFFRPISSDDGQSGPRPSCALCDEIHEHRNGTMIEMLERGFKWRRQPMLVMATNSGSDRQSVCWQEHQHAVRVAAGTREPDEAFTYVGEVIDDETFAFVCSLDPDDDPLEDPSCWVKANPLLGVTVQADYLAGVVRQAKAIPGKLNNILRLHFCVWTESDTAWMARPALEACLADFDPDAEHTGEAVYAGVDLSATQDLTAVAFVVPTGFVDMPRDDGTTARLPTFDAWVEAWTPADTLAERALRDNAPYDVWVREGWLHASPGRMVRFDFVAARLAELVGVYEFRALAYDRYGFKRHFEPEMDALGLSIPVVEHPQGGKKKGAESGLWMPGSKLALEQLILERRIRLCRSPVLIAAMMSAGMESDPFGNAWFSKRKAVNRIDALIALAMAVGAATATIETAPTSPWDDPTFSLAAA